MLFLYGMFCGGAIVQVEDGAFCNVSNIISPIDYGIDGSDDTRYAELIFPQTYS